MPVQQTNKSVPKAKVSDADFINAWKTSSTWKEVLEKTSMTKGQAYSKYRSFVKNRVQLKKLKTEKKDWDYLRRLALSTEDH